MVTDIGIDLGTCKTIVYAKNKGIIFKEPSVIAYNLKFKKVIAVGNEAYKMIGRVPEYIKVVRPISNGIISDYEFTEKMVLYILKKICYSNLFKCKIAICIPSIITKVEKNVVIDIAVSAGARKVYIIEEPIAAAIGEGIDISKLKGKLVIDIGGGSTDIAILSFHGIVIKTSLKIAGDEFDEQTIKVVKDLYNMDIGENTARKVKETIGTVWSSSLKEYNLSMEVKGKSNISGLPRKQVIYSKDLFKSYEILSDKIVKEIKTLIEKTPPDLLAEVQDGSILMTGGGSKLRGLKDKIESQINLKAYISDNAIDCVAIGIGKSFDLINKIDDGLTEEKIYKK